MRRFTLLASLLLVTSASLAQQVVRAGEPAIEGFTRRDESSVRLTFPGKDAAAIEVVLHDFNFEDAPVTTNKLHLKLLSPGVYEISSLAYHVGEWAFRVKDASSYYGLGEHFDTLNHTHQIVLNASQDNKGPKGTSTYKPIPFFMSTSGYGLWMDTTSEATFDMNAGNAADILIHVTVDRLRIVLFAGPQFPKILENFTALSGHAVLPPYWAFAPWKSRDYHQNDAQVVEDVERTRALGLPASVIMIDSPWATNYNTYLFNPKQFADATAMIKHIHEQGFKLVLWHTSWINSKTDTPKEEGFAGKIPADKASNYDEAAKKGYFIQNADGTPFVGRWWKGAGSLIDFTNPEAKQWWQDQVRQAVRAGADGFKDDDAEGSFLTDSGAQLRLHDNSDPHLMRNKYAVLYNNAVEEIIQKDLKGNGVLFTRSATVGNSNLPFLWGGDNAASFSPENGLPTVVTAGLGAGLSGMALWTADLGGYEKQLDTPNADLFIRWTEYAAFSPVMELISEANIGPWDYGDEALSIYRKYAVLHMGLFPYRYAAAQEAAKTGMPIMRALVLNYQDDLRAREIKDEYLFGPDFLVAPVVNENLVRPVYLPKGSWVNYWTGAQASGGLTVLSDAPLERIPVYVRAGAVIPKIPEDVMTLVPSSESGNTTVKTLDDRRVYELIAPFAADATVTVTDFEKRQLIRDANSLKITGEAARVTVRWKFAHIHSATVNGVGVRVQSNDDGQYIDFAHAGVTLVEWK